MGPAEPATCSARSSALGEPLLGTASRYRFWLLIEQPGPWGHDALTDSRFPPDVGAVLARRGRTLGVRVLLIKRRDDPRPHALRCFAAYTGVRDRRITSFEVEDPAELLGLDLRAQTSIRFAGLGEPVTGPLFLVCTHGKHDQCCARHGSPLYRALASLPEAWETTHIGGDRFAGNLVCFPHGIYFGRVPPREAAAVARGYVGGLIDLRYHRGRSCYSPPVQAAEHHLREDLGLAGVDDLTLTTHLLVAANVHRVEFRDPGGTARAVEVRVDPGDEQLLTCKATYAHRPRRFAFRTLA
jgi:hypothetical protein